MDMCECGTCHLQEKGIILMSLSHSVVITDTVHEIKYIGLISALKSVFLLLKQNKTKQQKKTKMFLQQLMIYNAVIQ